MTNSNQMNAGMVISVGDHIYRVESCIKVTVAKSNPFIKAILKDLVTQEVIEKNFKLGQPINEVILAELKLEFLYLEGKNYLFLDVDNLEQVVIPSAIIGDRVNYLKEGIAIKATSYGSSIFSVELPQFLELMVVKTEASDTSSSIGNSTKLGFLETGAKINVPLFVEVGDIIKVDTYAGEYIQRV